MKSGLMAIKHISQLDMDGIYTYADYMTWQFKERLELLRGKIALMSPAPNLQHQRIVTRLSALVTTHLMGTSCQPFVAPFDVRLPSPDGKHDTVVQPDICVVCDESKLDAQGCHGAPDLVVEVLSPGNSLKEMREKYSLYEEAGVKEYWLISPENPSLIRYVRNSEGKFIGLQPLTNQDQLSTELFPGLLVDLSKVF